MRITTNYTENIMIISIVKSTLHAKILILSYQQMFYDEYIII